MHPFAYLSCKAPSVPGHVFGDGVGVLLYRLQIIVI